MILTDLRQELEAARAEAARASNAGVVEKLDRILADLSDDLLLTTGEKSAFIVPPATVQRQRVPGLNRGAVQLGDNFNDPLPDEFWLGIE